MVKPFMRGLAVQDCYLAYRRSAMFAIILTFAGAIFCFGLYSLILFAILEQRVFMFLRKKEVLNACIELRNKKYDDPDEFNSFGFEHKRICLDFVYAILPVLVTAVIFFIISLFSVNAIYLHYAFESLPYLESFVLPDSLYECLKIIKGTIFFAFVIYLLVIRSKKANNKNQVKIP